MRKLLSIILSAALVTALTIPALAADSYHFVSENPEEFYMGQGIHTGELGVTVIAPQLETMYGLGPAVPANAPAGQLTAGGYGLPSGSGEVFYPDAGYVTQDIQPMQPRMTKGSAVKQKDGSLGTLKIPSIGLNAKVYGGSLTAAMRKGLGHMDSTSAWAGNVGLVGHNRGSAAYFGKLKNVKVGNTVTYQTSLGTRTYVVTFAGRIANNDWSYLQPTADNRISMITCVADRPDIRLLVMAVEKNLIGASISSGA